MKSRQKSEDRSQKSEWAGRHSVFCLLTSVFCLLLTSHSRPQAAEPLDKDHAAKMARGLDVFKKNVRGILSERCFQCHGGKSTESGLDLGDRDKLLKGGDTGPAILLGNGKESLLYKLVNHAKEPHMPHEAKRLADDEIAQLAAWIDLGAPYDGPLAAVAALKTPPWTEKTVEPNARQFWSFQPLRRVDPPCVKNETWCRTPIDRFILAKLEAAGVPPNPAVDRTRLIRRAYFDLTGLPPTPRQVEEALRDASAEWYDKLLDRILESPHYGERWARHWLDVARFAESHGFEHDYDRPTAYHYRDFVIKALNDDLPFNTFVKWQLAGDEYAPNNNLALTATGFLAAGVHSTQITQNEVEKQRYDEMDDMLATTGNAFLGLTIGCARCHDHKFDAIPQRDYYRLLSTFTTTVRSEVDLYLDPVGDKQKKAAFDQEHAPLVAALKKYETDQWQRMTRILQTPPAARTPDKVMTLVTWLRLPDPEWRRLSKVVDDHLKRAPRPTTVRALISTEGLPAVRLHTQGADFLKETHFLNRGDPNQKAAVASQSYLQVLMTTPDAKPRWHADPPKGWRTSYRRRALAEWLTDIDQGAGPLLARVIVNRLWQHHMGRGLVATPNDFGARGEPPTHPELLDWLATELIKNGWKLKPLRKLIMASATYQQSSEISEAKANIDRDNKLFWHRPRHRLEAEVIRDAILAVGGTLDPKMYGPGTLDEGSKRRSIYFTVKRSHLVPMMQVFDAPEALVSLGDRPTTTIAPQALLLMNNKNIREAARTFARRVCPNRQTTNEAAMNAVYRIALTRAPTAEELADGVAFVQAQAESYTAVGKSDSRELALADFCQAVMCLNEFVYVD
jgi:cytochrome c553